MMILSKTYVQRLFWFVILLYKSKFSCQIFHETCSPFFLFVVVVDYIRLDLRNQSMDQQNTLAMNIHECLGQGSHTWQHQKRNLGNRPLPHQWHFTPRYIPSIAVGTTTAVPSTSASIAVAPSTTVPSSSHVALSTAVAPKTFDYVVHESSTVDASNTFLWIYQKSPLALMLPVSERALRSE